MSKKLSDIRVEIDSIDNQVHDLFMRRAALVGSVAEAKKKEGLQVVHPAREAMMMRRLLSRHDGVLPRSTIVRIWRELISSAQLLQADLNVTISSCAYWDMAKNYFGSEIPMKEASSNQDIIKDMRDGNIHFAVMPWPKHDGENQWWVNLLNQADDNKISVICALPYGGDMSLYNDKALVISKVDFMPSDDDVSLIGVSLDVNIDSDFIMNCAKDAGLSVLNITSITSNYLIAVKGFVEEDSKALKSLKDALDECQYCGVIGGYPVIPNINN